MRRDALLCFFVQDLSNLTALLMPRGLYVPLFQSSVNSGQIPHLFRSGSSKCKYRYQDFSGLESRPGRLPLSISVPFKGKSYSLFFSPHHRLGFLEQQIPFGAPYLPRRVPMGSINPAITSSLSTRLWSTKMAAGFVSLLMWLFELPSTGSSSSPEISLGRWSVSVATSTNRGLV
ncbi:hypothetical protein FNV43_RR16938 [Rhamnella rubrinervis]|uniref:Uncharacterized protein n=1 Tax=Rhamnella rubrinervis TaxID=2594499 RepID=A0A8K0ME01_9ROSA|nr:hypothetical protein FNV43_RR16938 [Rhamnella rubrinervis]